MSRLKTGLSLVLVLPAGLLTKVYAGPGEGWVNDYAGGVLYEAFWCLAVFLILPRSRPKVVASAVFFATCGLEVLQLWHPSFLEIIRRSFVGTTLLGTSFDWIDFPHYVFGCGIGWGWMRWLTLTPPPHSPSPEGRGGRCKALG